MQWVDGKIESDAELRTMVEERLAEMRVEQELAALRERLGMTQRQLAARMGVSQPAIAKLESGQAKNIELRTLYRWATALGGQVKIAIESRPRRPSRTATR